MWKWLLLAAAGFVGFEIYKSRHQASVLTVAQMQKNAPAFNGWGDAPSVGDLAVGQSIFVFVVSEIAPGFYFQTARVDSVDSAAGVAHVTVTNAPNGTPPEGATYTLGETSAYLDPADPQVGSTVNAFVDSIRG